LNGSNDDDEEEEEGEEELPSQENTAMAQPATISERSDTDHQNTS
jgi:hypothetical protein